MSTIKRHSAHDDRGAAAVEFAIVSILLILLVVGMVGIARLYQVQVSVTHAAREGARLAAVDKFDLGTLRARAGVPDPSALQASVVEGSDGGGTFVECTVTYPITIGLPQGGGSMNPGILARTITTESTARMRAEY